MKYQYTSEGFENDLYNKKNQFQLNGVHFLILFNIVIYLLVSPNNHFIHYLFGVSSNAFEIWQLLTYMFLHGGLMHLFFNMFLLWMFGRTIESVWGTYKFLKFGSLLSKLALMPSLKSSVSLSLTCSEYSILRIVSTSSYNPLFNVFLID